MEKTICPWCGGELERGYLLHSGACFVPEGEKPSMFYSRASLEKHRNVMIPPNPNRLKLDVEWPDAWLCRTCQKIIVDYGDA